MRDEYNFENSVANPYKKAEREKITIQLNAEVIDYFKAESARTGVPYQNIINFYLIDCVNEGKKLAFSQMSLGFLQLEQLIPEEVILEWLESIDTKTASDATKRSYRNGWRALERYVVNKGLDIDALQERDLIAFKNPNVSIPFRIAAKSTTLWSKTVQIRCQNSNIYQRL